MNRADWMYQKKWGIFIHYLEGLQNNSETVNSYGISTGWNTCVEELDTELLAEQLKEIGAGYLIFTIMQGTKHLIAPNQTYERLTGYRPGEACSKRDLVLDLYRSLHKRGIDLCLYFTGDGAYRDPIASQAFGYKGYSKDVLTVDFVKKWASVLEEYSKRYQEKVKGWWIDGCTNQMGYEDKTLKIMSDAARAGNPDAAVAINYYGCMANAQEVDGIVYGDFYEQIQPGTNFCDYTAGELIHFSAEVTQPFQGNARNHILSFLGVPPDPEIKYAGWGKTGCKYSGEFLKDYVEKIHQGGGIVTIEACMYRDGKLDEEQFSALKKVEEKA